MTERSLSYSELRNSPRRTFFDDIVRPNVEGVVTSCPTHFPNHYSTVPYEIRGIFGLVEILPYANGENERIEDLTDFLA